MNVLSSFDWAAFHFIRPEWLWAIVPLIILVLFLKKLYSNHSGWQQVLPSHLHSALLTATGTGKRQSKPPLFLLAICWIVASLAMAGPTWERLPQPVYNLKQGSVILLDMSLSMRATDIVPDRLTRARFKAIDLVNQLSDGEVGMVAYAGDAFVISPLTEDVTNLTTLIPSVSPEIMPIPGSEPITGFEVAAELLANAGYQQGQIFWFTDGIEQQQFAELANFTEQSPYTVQALAIGTPDGAPIQQVNGELLKDSRGAIVVPRLTVDNIRAISARSGGSYALMSADDTDIQVLLDNRFIDRTDELTEDEQNSTTGDKWQDMGAFLVVLLLPFAAYAFRRGIIMLVPLLLLIGVNPSQVSYAQSADSEAQPNWLDLAFSTRDQLGQSRYDSENYAAAADQFQDPMWRGTSHFRNNDFEAALEAFSELDSTDARYNQGNALAHLGKLDEAIQAYEDVLKEQPDHIQAQENKALLESLKEQQEQQQQSNDSQDSDNQNESDQSESSEQDQQSDSQGEQSDSSDQSSDSKQNTQNEQPQDSAQNNDQQQPDADDAQMRDNEKPESQQPNQQAEAQSQPEEQPAQNQERQTMADETEQPLTEEQREQMQRMQTLLRRIPDDPAFLLQRKMQLESQQRMRDRAPPQQRKNW